VGQLVWLQEYMTIRPCPGTTGHSRLLSCMAGNLVSGTTARLAVRPGCMWVHEDYHWPRCWTECGLVHTVNQLAMWQTL
jgi:hypothetical protein